MNVLGINRPFLYYFTSLRDGKAMEYNFTRVNASGLKSFPLRIAADNGPFITFITVCVIHNALSHSYNIIYFVRVCFI